MAAAIRSDAEAYATARRREADAQAQHRLRAVEEHAQRVRTQLESVVRVLGEALDTLATELPDIGTSSSGPTRIEVERFEHELSEAEEHPMAEQVRPLRPPSEPVPRPPLQQVAPSHVPRGESESRLDDARLVALQMAVAGRSREEVGAHLRSAFEVGDPEPILDHVFAEGFPPTSPPGA